MAIEKDGLSYICILCQQNRKITGTKTCNICKIEKNFEEFNKRNDSKDGLKSNCRKCENKRTSDRKGIAYVDEDLIPEGKLLCRKCSVEKCSSQFYSYSKGLYGKISVCKECSIPENYDIPEFKSCSKCKISKHHTEFPINRRNKSMLSSSCKECKNKNNIKLNIVADKDGFKTCSKCKIIKSNNDFSRSSYKKDGLMDECAKCNAIRTKNWYIDNKDKAIESARKRINNNSLIKLSHTVRNSILRSFKTRLNAEYSKSKSSEEILGCSMQEFMNYIESKFLDGMDFNNHGTCRKGNCDKVWHLDHIIPISSAETEEDIYRLNHFSNFQPLWAIDNLKKHAKY